MSDSKEVIADQYVKVVKGLHYQGGFATKRTDSWTVTLVNRGVEKPICTGMNEWARYSESRYAEEVAQEWSSFLGWPIKRFEAQEYVTVTHKEVEL